MKVVSVYYSYFLSAYIRRIKKQGSDFWNQNPVHKEVLHRIINLLHLQKYEYSYYLHLDNDSAGRKAAEVISNLLKDKYTVKKHFVPVGKDVNDYLCYSKNLPYRTFEKEVACR